MITQKVVDECNEFLGGRPLDNTQLYSPIEWHADRKYTNINHKQSA